MQTQIEIKKEIIDKDGNNSIEVYTFKWELDETNSDTTFKKIYQDIDNFSKKIIFNLEWLDYMNSKSIWYIADIFSKTKDKSGILVLTSLTEEIDDTLDLVWVKSFIKVFSNNEEASLFIKDIKPDKSKKY